MWIVVVLMPLSAFSQLQVYSFSQFDSLPNPGNKNTVVFMHTDWCRYCQLMKNTTFKDKKVITLLNEKFRFAELNAEEKKDIRFNGHTFSYKPTGNNTGIHELAEQLGDGQESYPAICILNAGYEIVFQYNQFLSSADLLKVLNEALKASDGF